MLPANRQDVWQKATETEKIQALVMLSSLPSRPTSAGDLDNAAFMLALDGVTRYGLAEAVKFILKGALGHAFMPSPPELRIQCDKAMQWHTDEADRIRRRDRIAQDRIAPRGPLSPEQKARVDELMRPFRQQVDTDEVSFMERMLAKYGAEAIAQMPDNPKARERMGVRKAASE